MTITKIANAIAPMGLADMAKSFYNTTDGIGHSLTPVLGFTFSNPMCQPKEHKIHTYIAPCSCFAVV